MKIDIITLFPNMFKTPFEESIMKRAIEKNSVDIETHDLRKWTKDAYKTVDDHPYGGGPGMVMMIEPLYNALNDIDPDHSASRILLTARGERLTQSRVHEMTYVEHIVLICGHYEEIDERVHEYLVDLRIRIGDFVLSGGELPAMCLVDSIARLLPGVLGNTISLKEESFSVNNEKGETYLEYPHYTRPEVFTTRDGKKLYVPSVLLSGDHNKIDEWRKSHLVKL